MWNYRILAHKTKDGVYLRMHEVYCAENGTPNGYTAEGAKVVGDTLNEIILVLGLMQYALEKPILWAGDKFPQEYKPSINI